MSKRSRVESKAPYQSTLESSLLPVLAPFNPPLPGYDQRWTAKFVLVARVLRDLGLPNRANTIVIEYRVKAVQVMFNDPDDPYLKLFDSIVPDSRKIVRMRH